MHNEQGDQQVQGEVEGGLQVIVRTNSGLGCFSSLNKGSTRRGYTSTGLLGSDVSRSLAAVSHHLMNIELRES